MDQLLFNNIQRKFIDFLKTKKSTSSSSHLISEQVNIHESCKITEIEKTSIFGKDDVSIGYRIIKTDKNGKQISHIISAVTPPTTPS